MSVTLHRTEPETPLQAEILPLENGDRLDRATFHARYLAMPEGIKAELIGGVVYMASPTYARHGMPHFEVTGWTFLYKSATPGVKGVDNTTILLTHDGEVQPDVCLLLPPERGGRIRQEGDYLTGTPDLVVEVASSSASYDLHAKKAVYEAAGVPEYVVVLAREPRVVWLRLQEGRYVETAPGEDGLYRSEVFPGLWLDPAALLRGDSAALRQALERGLASAEHADFVSRLTAP